LSDDSQTGGDIVIHDDSDMLVIEDDITVEEEPQALAPRNFREGAEADADTQAILNRMREG
jgi:hypothetical protein